MFTIDKNVPVPTTSVGAVAKFPWRDMQPGDSFFAAGYSLQGSKKRGTGEKYLSLFGAKNVYPGSKWTTRTVTENGVVGVRVWRVA